MAQTNPPKKRNNLQQIAWILLGASGVITIYFIGNLFFNDYWIWGGKLSISETGEVGDFVGGFVGTIINAAAFLFLYLTLKDQREATIHQRESFEKENFENRFFEMIRLHKENVNEMEYNDAEDQRKKFAGRRVFKYINDQIESCFKEIAPIFARYDADKIYNAKTYTELADIQKSRPNVDLKNWAFCDIAYSIVFFGLSETDFETLSRHLERKYEKDFFQDVLNYVNLKPVTLSKKRVHWDRISVKPWDEIIAAVKRIKSESDFEIKGPEKDTYIHGIKVFLSLKFYKYYGGHQYKLGHYFRHLYQTVNYIDSQKGMTYQEKYGYIKTLRAQLSNYEQVIIFFNSLSFMGGAWELSYFDSKDPNKHLITKYNLIKNLPELYLFREVFVNYYYPEVWFEFIGEPAGREALEKQYREQS